MQPDSPTTQRTRRIISWLVAALVAAGVTGLATGALAGDWTRYTNDRFGASADVPAAGFVIQPPPDNNDGRSWKSTDGEAEIRIYGSFAGDAENFEQYRRQQLEFEAADGITVSYQTGKANTWFVHSGTVGGDIVYVRAIRAEPCSALVVNHIYFRYPADQKQRYAPIVAHSARSLHSEPTIACQ